MSKVKKERQFPKGENERSGYLVNLKKSKIVQSSENASVSYPRLLGLRVGCVSEHQSYKVKYHVY